MFEDCLLVKMKRSRPGQVVLDNQATHNYNEEKQTDATIYKHLFKTNKHVNTLNNIYQNMYQFHIKHSLPWADEGSRIISSNHYMDYMTGINNYQDQIALTLNAIEPEYDQMILDDMSRLTSMGNEHDYPPYDRFKNAWKVDVRFRPVPQSGDYRVEIPQEIKDALEKDLSELSQASLSLVKRDIVEAFQHAHTQIQKDDGERRLFQSMLDNIKDLLERVPKLNITGDLPLNAWCQKMTTVIDQYTIKDLRTFQAARSSFFLDTQELLEKL